jgi:hypothetical protein
MPLPRNNPIDLQYLTERDWWSKVDVGNADECWPWRQSTGSHGYGQTWDGRTVRLAHRVAWALHHQCQVPDDMTIDHRVDCLRICCNPAHLQVVTNLENATNNQQGRKTHCPRGHPYEGDNLKVYTNPNNGRTSRKCLACQAAHNHARFS